MAKNENTESTEQSTETTATPYVAPRKKFDFNSLNTLSVVSIATALTGFGAVAGVITGHVALTQLKTDGKSGRGLAIAGVVVGYAGIGLAVLGTIFKVGLGIWGARNGFDFNGHNGQGMMGGFGNQGGQGMMGGFGDDRGGFGDQGGFGGHMGNQGGQGFINPGQGGTLVVPDATTAPNQQNN